MLRQPIDRPDPLMSLLVPTPEQPECLDCSSGRTIFLRDMSSEQIEHLEDILSTKLTSFVAVPVSHDDDDKIQVIACLANKKTKKTRTFDSLDEQIVRECFQ